MAMDQNLLQKAERLAKLPYIVQIVLDQTTDDQPIYIAKNPELEGCLSQGKTPDEAAQNLSAARIDYIYSLLEDNILVPLPGYSSTYTGPTLLVKITQNYNFADLNPNNQASTINTSI
jgi:predicted RNase H-like HicB family nuclease